VLVVIIVDGAVVIVVLGLLLMSFCVADSVLTKDGSGTDDGIRTVVDDDNKGGHGNVFFFTLFSIFGMISVLLLSWLFSGIVTWAKGKIRR
jgi:hypothetical protein